VFERPLAVENLSGVHNSLGIKGVFNLAHDGYFQLRATVVKVILLQQAYAVLRGNTTAIALYDLKDPVADFAAASLELFHG
jgi:hypothetical protein